MMRRTIHTNIMSMIPETFRQPGIGLMLGSALLYWATKDSYDYQYEVYVYKQSATYEANQLLGLLRIIRK